MGDLPPSCLRAPSCPRLTSCFFVPSWCLFADSSARPARRTTGPSGAPVGSGGRSMCSKRCWNLSLAFRRACSGAMPILRARLASANSRSPSSSSASAEEAPGSATASRNSRTSSSILSSTSAGALPVEADLRRLVATAVPRGAGPAANAGCRRAWSSAGLPAAARSPVLMSSHCAFTPDAVMVVFFGRGRPPP